MKSIAHAVFILWLVGVAGCVNGGKFINTRGVLDESIYYVEEDKSNALHTISSSTYGPGREIATRVPQPALVDMYSTIQILLAKDNLKQKPSTSQFASQSGELINRKKVIVEALHELEKVVQARQQVMMTYNQKDLTQFYHAKKEAAKIERALIINLRGLWLDSSNEYSLLEEAYDPPSFGGLQAFLIKQITAIEEANREMEEKIKTHGRTLALEAFLNSPEKEPVAVHLDGYDSIQTESFEKRDRFGLDLSKEERDKLDANVRATQEMAAALERLRRGEATLNETVLQMRSLMLPQISEMIGEAESLIKRLDAAKLTRRKTETRKLFDAYLQMIQQKNKALYDSKKQELERDRDGLLTNLPDEAKNFLDAMLTWKTVANSLRQDWEKATPATMAALIDQTVKTARSFETLRGKLPQVASDVNAKALEIVARHVQNISEVERNLLLKSDEAQALLSNLEEYYRDFKEASDLISKIAASLSRMEQQPVAEMPSATASFQVPIEDIKNTFIDLELTPRLPGDLVVVKATLKEGNTVVDTSAARFRVERFGHYAELSPAVVLVKPEQLQGGDDGFRFAPVLSWMHHWYPRPENADRTASVFRALDPAFGINSAFTNFRSDKAGDSVQIGLGLSISFWKNRLQFGAGYNLMARSRDQGRYYYFVGSDLIGLLQTIGLAK